MGEFNQAGCLLAAGSVLETKQVSTNTIAFDARDLHPRFRHRGPGVVIDNILRRLSPRFHFRGLAHRFPINDLEVVSWPTLHVPKTNGLFFEVSPVLAGGFDLYWGTNDMIPTALRKPSVVTVHDLLLLNGLDGESHAWRLSWSLRRATRLISDSRTTADDLIRAIPAVRHKVEVVHLGFDATCPNGWRERPGPAASGPPFLVVLGAHRPRKNLSLAIAAVRRARGSGLNLRLRVTGNVHSSFDGPIREAGDAVELSGVLPKSKAFELLQNAVALLFPSLYEGFGFPILEAMSARCPVLALDTPINREIAGTAAWLLPPNSHCWAEAVRDLTQNHSLRQEFIAKGNDNIRRFSWEATAAAYGEVFGELCR